MHRSDSSEICGNRKDVISDGMVDCLARHAWTIAGC